MTDVAVIILLALVGMVAFRKVGLPGILGMIGAGILLGPSGFDMIDEDVLAVLKEFKTLALIVILFRAGLGIDRQTLNRLGKPAIMMGTLPAIAEGTVVGFLAWSWLGFPPYAAGMLGFIIAAVSPAVIVPAMLDLREKGFGIKKGIPTLILAGASLDDIVSITIFGIFVSLASGAAVSWQYVFLGVPAGVVVGVGIGAGLGFFAVWFFRKYHIRDTLKVILFLIFSVIFYDLSTSPAVQEHLPVAALLGIMTIGFVLLEKYDVLANRMALKFSKVWVLAEILLFVYIGTEIRLSALDLSLLGTGIIILLAGLTLRSLVVWFSLKTTGFGTKEKMFCVLAYWPKATVQAAMGAVPLSLARSGEFPYLTESAGLTILSLAVLSIIVTAPMGSIGIKLTGKRWLSVN